MFQPDNKPLQIAQISLILFSAVWCYGCSPTASDTNATPTPQLDSSETVNPVDSKPAPKTAKKVLRHVVCFEFEHELDPDQIENALARFADLPHCIAAIRDLQWGVNNSTEGQDDGFTHCFLLTFQNQAGQAEYLAHPQRQAFVKLIHPLLKQIHKFDYWAPPTQVSSDPPPRPNLRHVIFLKFRDEATEDAIRAVEDGFVQLADKVDEIKAFEWGRNVSTEKPDDGFTHCFIITFDSAAGRAAYQKNSDHWAFLEVLAPPMDKARVLDFFAKRPQ